MRDFIARKRRNNDYEDRSLLLWNRDGGSVRLRVSIAASVAYLLAVLLIARRYTAPERGGADLRDAAISGLLVAVPSAVADVARNIRDEELSDNILFFTTEPSALSITTNSSIFDNFINTKLADEWELSPSFYITPLLYVDTAKHQNYLRIRGHNLAF